MVANYITETQFLREIDDCKPRIKTYLRKFARTRGFYSEEILEDALQDGFKDFDDLKTNKNLKELRNVPVFEVVVKKYNPDFSLYSDLSAGDVSIKEGNGKQVIKAGDVSITLPND